MFPHCVKNEINEIQTLKRPTVGFELKSHQRSCACSNYLKVHYAGFDQLNAPPLLFQAHIKGYGGHQGPKYKGHKYTASVQIWVLKLANTDCSYFFFLGLLSFFSLSLLMLPVRKGTEKLVRLGLLCRCNMAAECYVSFLLMLHHQCYVVDY